MSKTQNFVTVHPYAGAKGIVEDFLGGKWFPITCTGNWDHEGGELRIEVKFEDGTVVALPHHAMVLGLYAKPAAGLTQAAAGDKMAV